jgi:hypothetical protein
VLLGACTVLLWVQVIAQPDERYESYCRGCDFIREHIFPGGHLPSMGAMVEAAHGTQVRGTELIVCCWFGQVYDAGTSYLFDAGLAKSMMQGQAICLSSPWIGRRIVAQGTLWVHLESLRWIQPVLALYLWCLVGCVAQTDTLARMPLSRCCRSCLLCQCVTLVPTTPSP